MLIFLGALALSNFRQAVIQEDRTTILARKRPSDADYVKLLAMPRASVESYYRQQGFVLVSHGSHRFFFAKDLWQEDEIQFMLKAYGELSKAASTAGFIASESPTLAAFVGNIFSAAGADVTGDSMFAVGASKTMSLTKNGRTIQLASPSDFSPEYTAKLSNVITKVKSSPLPRKDPLKTKQKSSPQKAVIPIGDLNLEDFGRDAMAQHIRALDLASAMEILAKHFEEYDAKKAALSTDLLRQLFGDGAKDLSDSPLSELSPSEQSALDQQIERDWQRLGFSDPNDAQNFLQGCSVTTSTNFEVSSQLSSGGWIQYDFR